ncbi:hypothetical protein AVI51_01195 [Piscirickettsia salmonis]|uniref:hypothetical protein n=1 Tax=Piscirickettsia salmonis TaxID=1238 RepID=UPI000332CB6E|nr:hypothetical protein [Piscirickettsia salmonis]RNC78015.1 hypothetical protein DA717_07025 [Piscirickettsiaceae bacterium NZ-RLO2]ALA24671.1 nickel transporter UreH [Piscirickettsia salmonis]APS45011.1 hypothetical protein AVI48_11925 [Piscirickettsia salmonis]APS48371.1 hypothetical protein AVI49_12530 [Piscirickettsia salmonis]APS49631.1 hypothetical protein AVI50_01230 [Piscirickettsia salmonis]
MSTPSFNGVIFASKAWFILLWGMCLIALLTVWLSAMSVLMASFISFMCVGYGVLLSYRYWRDRVVWLSWQGGDNNSASCHPHSHGAAWQFREQGGRRGQGGLVLHASFVSKLCLILALRCADRRRLYFIPVFYDAVPRPVYRRLKVLLRAYS